MANYRCPVCGRSTPGYWEFCCRGDCPDGRDTPGDAGYDLRYDTPAPGVLAAVALVLALAFAIYFALT